MTERIRFTVTQEHIDAARAEPWSAHSCPVIRALGIGWLVGRTGAISPDARTFYRVDAKTARFIEAFDGNQPVAPFTGEVRR